jgi:catechol 2,3-dioxygenase-like lactoylglutathione lyase family enzyme
MLLFSDDAEATRTFLRDTLGLSSVDAGDGWLIFALPPAELGIHPVGRPDDESGRLELWFMCHDLGGAMTELEAKGVEFTEPATEERFGAFAPFDIPGAGRAWLYEPRHASPLAEFS